MSTDRDELARIIAPVLVYTNPNKVQEFDDLTAVGKFRWISRAAEVADAILAAGYRKVSPDAETRTEWGVRRPQKFDSTVAWVDTRSEAEALAEAWGGGNVVVSRTVHVGPWTEVAS